MDAYSSLIIWDLTTEELSHLTSLQRMFSDMITPEKDLPPQYLKALIRFRFTLDQAKLTPWVAREFTDLGLIARASHELELYQPWASSFEGQIVGLKDEIIIKFYRRTGPLAEIQAYMKDTSFATKGDLTDGRLHYPSDKRRTKLTTYAMRQAERNLDALWSDVDAQYQKIGRKTLQDASRPFVQKPISARAKS